MRLTTGVILSSAVLIVTQVMAAPVSYLGGTYTQDFNGLPMNPPNPNEILTLAGPGPHDLEGVLGGSGVTGWAGSNYLGSGSVTEYRAQDGTLAGGSGGRGVVSFGAQNSTDRALGELPTSNQISRFGVSLVNNTSTTFTQFSLNFTGEQWRRGDILAPAATPGNTLQYQYSLTAANINSSGFTTLGSILSPNTQAAPLNVGLDGNNPANQVPVSLLVGGINWAPGATLTFRWNGFDISGQDDGLAIDNVSFSADVPEPSSILCAIMAAVGM